MTIDDLDEADIVANLLAMRRAAFLDPEQAKAQFPALLRDLADQIERNEDSLKTFGVGALLLAYISDALREASDYEHRERTSA